jgi:hypothetical protein
MLQARLGVLDQCLRMAMIPRRRRVEAGGASYE